MNSDINDNQPDNNATIDLSQLLAYYTMLQQEEVRKAQQLASRMYHAETKKQRQRQTANIFHWCPDISTRIMERVVMDGLRSLHDMLTFRHYLVITKVNSQDMRYISQRLIERVQAMDRADKIFQKIYPDYVSLQKIDS